METGQQLGQNNTNERVRVMVIKSRRLLEVWCDDTTLLSLPVALGSEPVGPKQRQGDGKTPEGNYYTCVRNGKSKYYKAIGINYPNRVDADRGLLDGLVSMEQHSQIIDALQNGKRPPWDTALGGEIMIHGGGTDHDWTAGCIALSDSDMDLLWELVPVGTKITIQP